MANKEQQFREAIASKKIPVLVLDNKWHQLFSQVDQSAESKRLESELNELLQRQGKVNTETKDIKKLKKKLMDEIVSLADELVQDPDNKKKNKDMEDHKRLVNECNEKIDDYEQQQLEIPREIDRVNKELMVETMHSCYEKLKSSKKEIDEIAIWIAKVRKELKKKLVRKQEKEQDMQNLYGYMHDIFGAEVIEIFDMQYMKQEKPKEDGKDSSEEK